MIKRTTSSQPVAKFHGTLCGEKLNPNDTLRFTQYFEFGELNVIRFDFFAQVLTINAAPLKEFMCFRTRFLPGCVDCTPFEVECSFSDILMTTTETPAFLQSKVRFAER